MCTGPDLVGRYKTFSSLLSLHDAAGDRERGERIKKGKRAGNRGGKRRHPDTVYNLTKKTKNTLRI